jgi:hypothetical protein
MEEYRLSLYIMPEVSIKLYLVIDASRCRPCDASWMRYTSGDVTGSPR